MRAGITLVTPPTVEPVTLPQAKAFLRVETDDDNGLIDLMIQGAREYIEEQCNFAFLTQTLDQTLDGFPYYNDAIDLLRGPVASITSITYVNANGQVTTWAPTNYIVNPTTKPPRIAPQFGQFWPIVTLQPLANVTVRFVAGVASADLVPARYKQALYMILAHWYENRPAVEVERTQALVIPLGTDAIIAGLKPPLFA